MKLKIKYILILLSVAFASCESFLDRQPDDQLTSENVFEKENSTWKYLVNVYSYILNQTDLGGYGNNSIAVNASDEASCAYTGSRAFALWTHNQLTPLTTHGGYRMGPYTNQYRGIREATFFMNNVYSCPELTNAEKEIWNAEARFLRAFFYTELLRWNGPVIFIGDGEADFSDPDIDKWDRSPWDKIVAWVCSEYDKAAAVLPDTWGGYYLGRATKGAALAMKARLLMYNARPLFNGQNGTGIYDDIVNKDGEKLFNTVYDESRWKEAADAAKAVIDMHLYSMVNDPDKTPLQNIHESFISMNSPENIFVYQVTGQQWRIGCTPSGIGGTSYGGVSATQKLVDAFAMENGRYPITNMEDESYNNGGGTIEIDPLSGYSETGYSAFVHPFFATFPNSSQRQTDPINTMNMYVGREPRFYANMFWSGQTWVAGTVVKKNIQFYAKGANGPQTSNNYPPTGYLCLKFIDPTINTTSGSWGYMSMPLIRYADILLMYAEALNEYDPSNPDIFTYWNMVRERAGVPDIEEVYPEIVGDRELQRKYIRRERMVEFCFEGLRYFDTRTWMTAEQEDDGDVFGCNVRATNHNINGEYWKRTSVFDCYGEGGFMTKRTFTERNYLFPFNQEELDRCPNLTQNLGW